MIEFSPSTEVDFVIIGAGAAGGVMAKELSTAGFQVVVMEQGPYLTERDFHYDQLRHHSVSLVNDHSLRPNTFRMTAREKAVIAPVINYGCCVGGGTLHYTAVSWRFNEVDFIERGRWGPVAGAGLEDWPITYGELEPYYTKAEWDLGISGQGFGPLDPPRSKPYPLPPMPIKSSGVLLHRAASKLKLHTTPVPIAVLSQTYRGRSGCAHCGYCSGFGCKYNGAKSSTLVSTFPVAEQTGRCEVRTNSYVREIATNKIGRVTGVAYFDTEKREVFQKAKAVILSANGTETPRLLLMSNSSLFPNGLANSSGLVGKYLMLGGVGASAFGIFEHPLNEYKGVGTSRAIQDFYDSDPKRGFFGGGHLDGRGPSLPVGFALGGLSPETPRWGSGFKNAVKEGFTRTMTVSAFCTLLAQETNTITLDPDVKDAWGLPAMRVTYKDHPDDLKVRKFFAERALELLEAAGAIRKWAAPVTGTRTGGHLVGTCRMGNDPKTSVVDKFHRAHDVPNLFIVDGSSFVTSGRNHPTLTIQALAYRAADNIIHSAKTGSI